MSDRDEFSVYLYFPDGSAHRERAFVGAEQAVSIAKECSERPAAMAGWIRRIIITDGGDYCVFEWLYGRGVTYPPLTGRSVQ